MKESKETIKLDDEGVLLEPNLHDAEIIGFAGSRKRSIQLLLNTEKQIKYELHFVGVTHFCVREMYSQNIIREVNIHHRSNEKKFKAVLNEYSEIITNDQRIDAAINYVVEIVPSVGANLLITITEFEIRTIHLSS